MKSNARKFRLAGCVIGMALLSAGNANAACTQADLTGTWRTVGFSGDLYYGSMDEIDRCKIVIASTGAIVASRSSCVLKESSGEWTVGIAAGALKVSSSCAVSGSMRLCYLGSCITGRVQSSQLARDKNIMPMVGYLTSDPTTVFSYTAVKQ